MVRIAEYPPEGIRDATAFRVEVGLVAYEDGQLTLRQLAEFLGLDEAATLEVMAAHGVEYVRDEDYVRHELAMIDRLGAQSKAA